MATSHEHKSAQRKVVYFVIILALFTVTLFLRRAGLFAVAKGVPVGGLESQAKDMKLREQDVGNVELTASAVRLSLFGSRGFVVCALWLGAIDKQKKHEWNELEVLVNSITKLEPHFVTPW